MGPDDPNIVFNLTGSMSTINEWMSKNLLKLNEDKTEILVVGPKNKRDPVLETLVSF